jgi:hypothetical protein
MARNAPTDDEVSRAKDVLERAYRSWVNDLAEEILYECFTEDLDDSDVQERVDERTDSGLIYTHDQWTALTASRSTQQGWDELRDMGSTDTEDPVPAWAVLTYRIDVQEIVFNSELYVQVSEGSRLGERVQWLIEEHGGHEYPLGEGSSAYIVGEVENVNFGILVTKNDYHDHEFIGRSMEPENLKVLMDLLLEEGGDTGSERVRSFLRRAAGAR